MLTSYPRSKTHSKASTSRQKLSSSPHISSKKGQQDPQSTSHKASDFATSNETHDLFDESFLNEEHPADLSTGQSSHRQQHDLLGLALQIDNSGLPGNKVHASNEVSEATPHDQEQVFASLCPMHKALLAGVQSSMDGQPGQARELKYIPMERYLAEDLEERYALFNLGRTSVGEEWVRYSGCLCMPK